MWKSSRVVYWLDENLYLNITNRCSNDCYFCLRRFKRGVGGFDLRLREEPSLKEVIKELQEVINKRRWSEVVFCGFGEPLERLDCVLEAARWAKRFHGKGVRVDTNGHGYRLNEGHDVAVELKEAGVDRVSVSLNAHNEETYNQVCRPRLEGAFKEVLKFVEKARDAGLDTEITAVTIPEADIKRVMKIASKLDVGFKARKHIPCFW